MPSHPTHTTRHRFLASFLSLMALPAEGVSLFGMSSRLCHVIAACICCVVSACMSPISDTTRDALFDSSGEIRPGKEVVEIMLTLPLPERYDVYIKGLTRIHPLYTYVADGMIPLGEKAIPFLSEKLKTLKKNDKWEKIHIINLLGWMSAYGCYDVKSDAALFELIIDAGNSIIRDDPSMKGFYVLSLGLINEYGKFKGMPECDP
jgi:hypothetical protein